MGNVDFEFKVWFTFAIDIAESIGVEPSLSRTALFTNKLGSCFLLVKCTKNTCERVIFC